MAEGKKDFNLISGIFKALAFIGTKDTDVWLQVMFYWMSLYFYLIMNKVQLLDHGWYRVWVTTTVVIQSK